MLQRFLRQNSEYSSVFPFAEFNAVQKACFERIFKEDGNMIISAPTSSGKTVLFELLIVKAMINKHQRKASKQVSEDQLLKPKCLYLAPIKSLCHEKANSWKKKFLTKMHVVELTGDNTYDSGQFEQVMHSGNIFIATPEKVDYISRQGLDFLKQIEILLLDQIHMLNMEERGAILEAIVSRIISINADVRVMAVSATIPNIEEVGRWLKVPRSLVLTFGEEYRPARLNKIVMGFKAAKNDFNFEKSLNFKILDVIRQYSEDRGTLIFCQTQKGTEEACNKIVQQSNRRREFIEDDRTLKQLMTASREIQNSGLRQLIAQGLAFHNASLSLKDRSIVEALFLDRAVKVLCTTSTLAMGINLPARLVVIKSTKCYKGSSKGYQEYSRIEMDQMMGRAGRVPFDREGTVVIMTEKANYNRYLHYDSEKMENLDSQLYQQLIEHLNTEISLGSIRSLSQATKYVQNSFCYVRMQSDPELYLPREDLHGERKEIKSDSIQDPRSRSVVQSFVKSTCLRHISRLSKYSIITYNQESERLFPNRLSTNLSKNSVEIETMISILEELPSISTERKFLEVICQANELSKYRSKLDERKCLKQINTRIKYSLKEAISTPDRKCFVLIQAKLSDIPIDNWEMRRQASDMVFFLKRLLYCIKTVAYERRNRGVHGQRVSFWSYLYAGLFFKYFQCGFWEKNEEKVLRQIKKVDQKWKNIQSRGVKTIDQLTNSLQKLETFGTNVSSMQMRESIEGELRMLNESIRISVEPAAKEPLRRQSLSDLISEVQIHDQFPNNKRTVHDYLLRVNFSGVEFDKRFNGFTVSVESDNHVYLTYFVNKDTFQEENQSNGKDFGQIFMGQKEVTVMLKDGKSQRYFVSIIKDGNVGFDEFYWFEYGSLRKTTLSREQEEKRQNFIKEEKEIKRANRNSKTSASQELQSQFDRPIKGFDSMQQLHKEGRKNIFFDQESSQFQTHDLTLKNQKKANNHFKRSKSEDSITRNNPNRNIRPKSIKFQQIKGGVPGFQQERPSMNVPNRMIKNDYKYPQTNNLSYEEVNQDNHEIYAKYATSISDQSNYLQKTESKNFRGRNHPRDFNSLEEAQNSSTVKRSKQLKLTDSFNMVKKKFLGDDQKTGDISGNKEMFGVEQSCNGKKLKQWNENSRIGTGKHLKEVLHMGLSGKYGDLKDYNWKPGFEQIKDLNESEEQLAKMEQDLESGDEGVFMDTLEDFNYRGQVQNFRKLQQDEWRAGEKKQRQEIFHEATIRRSFNKEGKKKLLLSEEEFEDSESQDINTQLRQKQTLMRSQSGVSDRMRQKFNDFKSSSINQEEESKFDSSRIFGNRLDWKKSPQRKSYQETLEGQQVQTNEASSVGVNQREGFKSYGEFLQDLESKKPKGAAETNPREESKSRYSANYQSPYDYFSSLYGFEDGSEEATKK